MERDVNERRVGKNRRRTDVHGTASGRPRSGRYLATKRLNVNVSYTIDRQLYSPRRYTRTPTSDHAYQRPPQKALTDKPTHLKVIRLRMPSSIHTQPCQMDIQKRRDMALIKETYMPQVNRLFEQHRRWYHPLVHKVPQRPHVMPFIKRRETEGRGYFAE